MRELYFQIRDYNSGSYKEYQRSQAVNCLRPFSILLYEHKLLYKVIFLLKKKDIKYYKMIDLTEEQIERYSRHILLQDVGLEGQEKLLNAKVLIIGAGGLGSPVASTSLRLAWDISVS